MRHVQYYILPHMLILCGRKSRNQLSSIPNYIKSYKLVLQNLSQELKSLPEKGKEKERKEMKNKRTKLDNPLEGIPQGRLRGRICSHPSGKSPSYLTYYMN